MPTKMCKARERKCPVFLLWGSCSGKMQLSHQNLTPHQVLIMTTGVTNPLWGLPSPQVPSLSSPSTSQLSPLSVQSSMISFLCGQAAFCTSSFAPIACITPLGGQVTSLKVSQIKFSFCSASSPSHLLSPSFSFADLLVQQGSNKNLAITIFSPSPPLIIPLLSLRPIFMDSPSSAHGEHQVPSRP